MLPDGPVMVVPIFALPIIVLPCVAMFGFCCIIFRQAWRMARSCFMDCRMAGSDIIRVRLPF